MLPFFHSVFLFCSGAEERKWIDGVGAIAPTLSKAVAPNRSAVFCDAAAPTMSINFRSSAPEHNRKIEGINDGVTMRLQRLRTFADLDTLLYERCMQATDKLMLIKFTCTDTL